MVNKNDLDEIKRRIYNVVPVGTYQMQEIFSIFDIKVTEDDINVPSACVTCDVRPTMLLNKHFIDQYCKTDEHLFMLVMHELYHIILGHTTLFKRHTIVDNIAFDAIINAMLCKEYPDEECASFFKEINASNMFPSCILRPADGNTPKEARELLDELYNKNTGTYYEVYLLLKRELKDILDNEKFVLIGNHDEEEDSDNNKLLKKMIEELVARWPRPINIIEGRDMGGALEEKKVSMSKKIKMHKNLRKLLKKASIISGIYNVKNPNIKNNEYDMQTFIPNYIDRSYYVKKEMIGEVLLYNKNTLRLAMQKERPCKSNVYLDVSGSVIDDIKKIMPILVEPYKNKKIKLYQFSTEVHEIKPKDFEKGNVKSTCGTDVNAIMKHYFDIKKYKRPKKIIILTDGYVGHINRDYMYKIKANKTKIYVGLFGKQIKKEDLNDISEMMLKID